MRKITGLLLSTMMLCSVFYMGIGASSTKDLGYQIMVKDNQDMIENWDEYAPQDKVPVMNRSAMMSSFAPDGGSGIDKPGGGKSIGEAGDIIYSADSITGHSGLIIDADTIIESRADGVNLWPNKWTSRYTQIKACRVSRATTEMKRRAINYSIDQLGEPYNWNFFNKWATTTWYCSQLCWRAYYEQGIDLEYGNPFVITPADLIKSSETEVFFSTGF